MIILFLLSTFIIQIQASQHPLTPPISYGQMSVPELKIHEMLIKQDMSKENMRWRKEKVCCGISRETVGTGCTCFAVSAVLAAGVYLGPEHIPCLPSCMYASTEAIRLCCQLDQHEKKKELQEIRTQIKLKTE